MFIFSKYLSKAISVDDPFSSGLRWAVLFTSDPILKYYPHLSVEFRSRKLSLSLEVSIWTVFSFQNWVNVILFMVSVPVLSEHILSAPPMVSHAYIFLTRLLSFNIFLTETARDRVTERGRPSGIATTTTVIARIKKLMSSFRSVELFHFPSIIFYMVNLTKRTIRIAMAENRPNFPISSATSYNLACRGVAYYSSWVRRALIFPIQDCSPTTNTMILPYPVSTLVPLRRMGEGISWEFSISSVYPH